MDAATQTLKDRWWEVPGLVDLKLGPVDWTFNGKGTRLMRQIWAGLTLQARADYCYKALSGYDWLAGAENFLMDDYATVLVRQQAVEIEQLKSLTNGRVPVDQLVRIVQRRYNMLPPDN